MSAAAALNRIDPMAHEYKPAPESKTPLSLRVPVSLKRKIEVLVRLWKAQAIARGEDPTNIDNTHVAVALLDDGTSSALDLLGGMPVDEAATVKMETAIKEGTPAHHPKKK